MRATIGVLLAGLLALPSAARAGDKDEIQVIGFSEDATAFAYITFGVHDGSGFPHAELHVVSTLTGKANDKLATKVELEEGGEAQVALGKLKASIAKTLAAEKLGKDPGAELYKSGTAVKTTFTAAGKPVDVHVDVQKGSVDDNGIPKDRVAVRLERAGKKATLLVGGGGYDYSLNSVRLSADGRSVVVMLKHSEAGFEGPNRRYLCAAGRMPQE
jgi:predicted secreted protein